MEISYAGKADIPAVIELWKRAGVFYEPEDRPEVRQRLLDFDSAAIIAARDGRRIVGRGA